MKLLTMQSPRLMKKPEMLVMLRTLYPSIWHVHGLAEFSL